MQDTHALLFRALKNHVADEIHRAIKPSGEIHKGTMMASYWTMSPYYVGEAATGRALREVKG